MVPRGNDESDKTPLRLFSACSLHYYKGTLILKSSSDESNLRKRPGSQAGGWHLVELVRNIKTKGCGLELMNRAYKVSIIRFSFCISAHVLNSFGS